MASSYSNLLALELMATGENENTWGDKTNDNLDKLEQKLVGRLSITFADAQITLSHVNGGDGSGATNAANMILDLGGTNTSSQNLVIPNLTGFYLVNNETSEDIVVKTAGTGDTVTIPHTETQLVWCDGSDNVNTINSPVSGTVALATNALQLGGVVAASYAQLAVKQSWTKPQRITPTHVSLTANAYTPNPNNDSHIVIDQSEMPSGGTVTINDPGGGGTPLDGQILIVDIEQHATTPSSVTWGGLYVFPDDANINLTQTAGKVDTFAFQYSSNLNRWLAKGNALNFPRT